MASLTDPGPASLLAAANHAVITTVNPDGSLHSAVVWQETAEGALSVNSAVGRKWPTNLSANPTITVLVYAQDNPYEYVEVRGRAVADTADADAQIDRLAKKYINADTYPFRSADEQRIKFTVEPSAVIYRKQG